LEHYQLTIVEKVDNDFFKAFTDEGIALLVYRPFCLINDEEVINKKYTYIYINIDTSGSLDFRHIITFEDVVKSRALKVIAFDNLRKEYENSSNTYEKLFKDYDSFSNLWVLSYGNALEEIIENKVRNGELDIAFLLLEVLVEIESWVLNSGYTNSFKKNNIRISQNAKYKIEKAQFKIQAISLILNNEYASLVESIKEGIKNIKRDSAGLTHSVRIFAQVLRIIPSDILFREIFLILNIIKDNKDILFNLIAKEVLYDLYYQVRYLLEHKQKQVFNRLFISPEKRSSFYSGNKSLKDCILLSIWLTILARRQFDRFLYTLKCLRLLTAYINNTEKQEKIMGYVIQTISGDDDDFGLDFEGVNLTSTEFEPLISSLILKKTNNNIGSADKKWFKNKMGYVLDKDGCKLVIPYTKNNTSFLGKKKKLPKVNILAHDSMFSFQLGSFQSPMTTISNIKDTKLTEGLEIRGIIKRIVDFGIFVSFGKYDGLLHISKISYQSTDLNKIFDVGEEIEVRIDKIADGKIELDRKSILRDKAKRNTFEKGRKIEGVIYRIDQQHGAFLELENGASGFIPKKEFCLNEVPESIENYFEIGTRIVSEVIKYDANRGYTLSIKSEFRQRQFYDLLQVGRTYRGRYLLVNDIKTQIQKRIDKKIDWDECRGQVFCPKCQQREYEKSNSKSSLEIDPDGRNWFCLWCDYKSKEHVVFRLLEVPFTVFCNTEDISDADFSAIENGEAFLKVEEIIKKRYIRVSIVQVENIDSNIIDINLAVDQSKAIGIELGFLYEQFAGISELHKEDYFTLCRYFFGYAKMSRSYFHAFLGDYMSFAKSLEKSNLKDVKTITNKAKSLLDSFGLDPKALQTFPVLNYIIESLKIISLLNEETNRELNDMLFYFEEEEKFEDLIEALRLAIAFSSIPIDFEHLREEIWNAFHISIEKKLRLYQNDWIDEDIIKLRKRIKQILNNNIEDDYIECKSSLEMPVPSKRDQIKIDRIELELRTEDVNSKLEELNKELESLKKPKANKDIKKRITISWLKTIVAFANTGGGELLIGIGEDKDDNLILLGIEADLLLHKSEDKLLLFFDNKFETHIGNEFQHLVKVKFVVLHGKTIIHVKVDKSLKPVFLRNERQEKFYVRRNASTKELTMREFSEYKDMNFAT